MKTSVAAIPGNDLRFQEFVARYRPQWLRSANGILRNWADAEDVVQDTLADIWPRWETDSLADPPAYVSHAVRMNALKRRARRRSAAPLDDALHVPAPSADESRLDPMQLERAIADLPPAQQAVVRTRYYVGLTFEQVGRHLSISANTAASRCRYALASLRRRLSPERKVP